MPSFVKSIIYIKHNSLWICWRSQSLTSSSLSAMVSVSWLQFQILELHSLYFSLPSLCVGIQRHVGVLEGWLWLLWPRSAVTVCCRVFWEGGSWTLGGEWGRVNGDSDRGRCRYCGDGLTKRSVVTVLVWEVMMMLLVMMMRLRVVGRVAAVACWVFSVATRAVMAPSLSSSFKSVQARLGWGQGLPVLLASGVPAAVSLSIAMLEPRITTLRGNKL